MGGVGGLALDAATSMCVSRAVWVFRTPEFYDRDGPLTVSAGTTATWVISFKFKFKFEFTSSKKALRSSGP